MERLIFCWYCMSYHDQTHYCTTLKIWRKIDYGNCIVFSGPDRDSVDRYKDDFSIEHKVKISLFRSKSNLNQLEKSNAEEWTHQQRVKQDEKEATEYFENHRSRFEEMTHQDSVEYLRNQNFRNEMFRRYVEIKVSNLQQEMQKMKEAEKWFKENLNMKYHWNKQEKYNEILKQNFRDSVQKKLVEMLDRQYNI